jgi:ABC-type branched-subunit amino acid transport system permease subunit
MSSASAPGGAYRRRRVLPAARRVVAVFTEYYLIPVGVIFVAMVIFMPQGLLGFMALAQRVGRWLRSRQTR